MCFLLRTYRRIQDISEDPEELEEEPIFVIIEIVDFFGINHPDLAFDKNMKETLQKVLENSKVKSENMGNVIYQERQIMGYMFVFDMTESTTLQDVYLSFLILVSRSYGLYSGDGK